MHFSRLKPNIISFRFLLTLVVLNVFLTFATPTQTFAQSTCTFSASPTNVTALEGTQVSISGAIFNGITIDPSDGRTFYILERQTGRRFDVQNGSGSRFNNGSLSFRLTDDNGGANFFEGSPTYNLALYHYVGGFGNDELVCELPTTLQNGDLLCTSFSIDPSSGPSNQVFTVSGTGCGTRNGSYNLYIELNGEPTDLSNIIQVTNGSFSAGISGVTVEGAYDVWLIDPTLQNPGSFPLGQGSFTITSVENVMCGDPVPPNSPDCPATCPSVLDPASPTGWSCTAVVTSVVEWKLCRQAYDESNPRFQQCLNCHNTSEDGIWTAFGCIRTKQDLIVTSLSRLGLGLGGGIALILVLYGSFTISTSTSNPQRLQNGQQILISALVGLLFMILSVVVLQFMGVEILRIPGF